MATRFRPAVGFALLLLSQGLFACSQAELQDLLHSEGIAIAESEPQTSKFSPDGGQQYGVDGTISARQLAVLRGLAWPQKYEDMTGTFGFPMHRTESADYYAIKDNASTWAVVFYDGPTATGYTEQPRE